ncbi:hypothetical protein DPMN_097266 [Dreissena polymorpha]|uniref:Uncharacterized protein n=1 Tax=Dreissena polymorpha TaxID=45954 RepID=A0A9D4R5K8_DREPO|nr:hypothetical protein DPMN_097266 [Dreissena polymorpha]
MSKYKYPPTETMAITGHKNVQSLTNYSNISVEQLQKCSFLLSPVNVTIQQFLLYTFTHRNYGRNAA